MHITFHHPFFAAAAAVAVLSFTVPVLAQSAEGRTCEVDADCEEGLVCRVVGATGGCSAPTCPEGEDCDVEPVCEETEWRACVAPPCTTDEDCGAGLTCVLPEDGSLSWCEPKACTTDADCGDASLKCFKETWEECSHSGVAMPDCAPDAEDCPKPEPAERSEDCTTLTESYCAPRYLGPCETAADCGAGFDCVPEQVCWCSGSAGSAGTSSSSAAGGASSSGSESEPSDPSGAAPDEGPAESDAGAGDTDGDDEDVSEDVACGCELTGTNYCAVQEIPCEDDAACPEDWSCVEPDTAAVDCDPAGSECIAPEPMPSLCEPPSWGGDQWYTVGLDGGGQGSAVSAEPTRPEDVLDDDEDDDTTGDAQAGATEEEAGADAAEDASEDGGCQVAMGSQGGGSALGLLLGLVGLGALRRRR
ncbi:MAG: hypothetical protein JW751_17970 [Polyangiaceae bacterium]|nr:hypothetical protein [Polyangiaceae bacterium]